MSLCLPGGRETTGQVERDPAGLSTLCVLMGVVEQGGRWKEVGSGEGEKRPQAHMQLGIRGRALESGLSDQGLKPASLAVTSGKVPGL